VVLVTLGGCHLLDGWVACDSVEARVEIVCGSGGGFMRGIVLTPWGSQRAILVKLMAWRIPILRVDVRHPLRV
jgi:hypothetical protein